MRRLLQVLIAGVGAFAGFQFGSGSNGSDLLPFSGGPYIFAAAGALLFYAASWFLRHYGLAIVESAIEQAAALPGPKLAAGIIGLLLGLAVSALAYPAFSVFGTYSAAVSAVISLILGYSGFRLGYQKSNDLAGWMKLFQHSVEAVDVDVSTRDHKILDTSVIIDGRIADICKTGFIEGTLVIPEFVLEELQHIADSSDLLKRNRGRRGLDILNKIQKELDVKVLIYEGDFEDISEVDSKLVRLAKVLQGKVVTNDFNLNKVCELQGVAVLNINDLANSVKPVVLPGEELPVHVIKDGKEFGQGVAYLDDGTMIVVEGGRDYIGATIDVLVTSVLQTSAGRMIFAKPKVLEKAL